MTSQSRPISSAIPDDGGGLTSRATVSVVDLSLECTPNTYAIVEYVLIIFDRPESARRLV